MSALLEQNQAVRQGIVLQIVLQLERELGKPPAHPMAVRRLADTVARRIAGEEWRILADRAIYQWQLG